MEPMSTGAVVAVATPITLGMAWLLYELGGFDELKPVRRLLTWAARLLMVVALVCPPAAAVAFMWVVTQEQDRINDLLVEPMLDQITSTTTTTAP